MKTVMKKSRGHLSLRIQAKNRFPNTVDFASREHEEKSLRPVLRVRTRPL